MSPKNLRKSFCCVATGYKMRPVAWYGLNMLLIIKILFLMCKIQNVEDLILSFSSFQVLCMLYSLGNTFQRIAFCIQIECFVYQIYLIICSLISCGKYLQHFTFLLWIIETIENKKKTLLETNYSRVEWASFVEDSPKFFNGCLPQNLLSLLLNTLSHLKVH